MSLDVSPPSATIAVNVSTTRLHQGLRWALRPQIIVLSLLILLLTAIVVPSLPDAAYARAAERAFTAAESAPTDAAKLEAAAAALQQAGRWAFADPTLYRRMAQLYLRHGRSSDAIAVLEQAYRMQPESLLVAQDLAQAYEAAGETQRAGALWARIGMTPERMIMTGNSYLDRGQCAEALVFYQRAIDHTPALAPGFALRHAVASLMCNDLATAKTVMQHQASIDTLTQVYTVQDSVTIPGVELRWLQDAPAWGISFGMPLAKIEGLDGGIFWWSGDAFALIQVKHSGEYAIDTWVRNDDPPPIQIGLGVNGHRLAQFQFERGDNTWGSTSVQVSLQQGWHLITLSFLNDDNIEGKDRNAIIQRVDIRPLP